MKEISKNIPSALNSNPEESILLLQVAAGNRAAFNQLYYALQPHLSRFLEPFKSIADPAEIIQDICFKLWLKRDILPAITSIKAYSFKMAKNRILDLKKKQIIEQQHLKDYSTSIPSHSSPNDELEFHELNRNTQRAIEALPERQKCIFKLAVLQDYNRVQISENLQLSLAVVDKQLYLATKSIRKYILQKT